jgi:hypothetical protein
MRIVGEWHVGDDGTTRPTVVASVQAADGSLLGERFLIDTGADRTVLSADLLARTALSAASAGTTLAGVGGTQGHVIVRTALEIARDDGGTAIVRGEYAAFTDLAATDLSILGRDVLDLFDLIVSRPRNEILLLAGNHQFRVEAAATP